MDRLNELSLNESSSSTSNVTAKGLSSPDSYPAGPSSEHFLKTGNGSVTSGDMGGSSTVGGEASGSDSAGGASGSVESPVAENETALAIKKRSIEQVWHLIIF